MELKTGPGSSSLFHVSGSKTENVSLKNSEISNPDKDLIVEKEVPAKAVTVVN